MKRTVLSVLEERDREVWSIPPSTSVQRALTTLQDYNLGAIVVVENDTLVGIFSERDYVRKIALTDREPDETIVGEVMTPNPFSVNINQSVDDCAQIMIDGNFRHLPVLDNGQLVGVVSMIDVIQAVMQNQASLIMDLERYISG